MRVDITYNDILHEAKAGRGVSSEGYRAEFIRLVRVATALGRNYGVCSILYKQAAACV